MLAGMTALTTQSFWMDEASTATIAKQPTLAAWWHYMSTKDGSDTQMPLYMIYAWCWAKLFGCSELILRASNLPWLLLGLLAWPRREAGFILTLAVSPFLWYYMDEARPYVMQISASLMLGGALARLFAAQATVSPGAKTIERIWFAVFCGGLVILSGSSLLGMLWSAAAVAALVLVLGVRWVARRTRESWLTGGLTALVLGGLAVYYVWTLRHGNAASPGTTGVGNVFFIIYELCGFAGLGPGRAEIHGGRLAAFHGVYLLPLALYALVLAAVLFTGLRAAVRAVPLSTWVGLILPLGGMAGFLVFAGLIRHFSVLGRHFAPMGAAFLLLLGWCVQTLLAQEGWRRRLAVGLLLVNLASAGSLRWCERHEKDDYRAAARFIIAAHARGERIWWCADGTAGNYYGVPLSPPLSDRAAPGKVWLIANPLPEWLTNNPVPTLVLLSKPELHDRSGKVQDYLKQHEFQCQKTFSVFTVWTRP